MNEYQITFLISNNNTRTHITKPLNRVIKKFKCTLHIINITSNRVAQLNKSLAILQVGLQQNDLCQITAIGVDAELACFVIKDIIASYFTVVGSQINHKFSDQLIQRIPQLKPPCDIEWHYYKAYKALTKFECLQIQAQLIHPKHPDELLLAFIKREEISPTCIGPGIALPHVMFADIQHINIAVIANDTPINWESTIGNVHLAIALVMPENPSREQIITATNLTRNLLTEPIVERLLLTRNSIDLQTLLMYAMSRLLS